MHLAENNVYFHASSIFSYITGKIIGLKSRLGSHFLSDRLLPVMMTVLWLTSVLRLQVVCMNTPMSSPVQSSGGW